MKIDNIGLKWQLTLIAAILVALPIILLGSLSYSIAKKSILSNTEAALKAQSVDWLITARLYYDLIQKDRRSTADRANDIITSQAKEILDLMNTQNQAGTSNADLKEPLSRARKYEDDMLLYGFTTVEFESYAEKFDLAIAEVAAIIKEAETVGFDSEEIKQALSEYKEQMDLVKSRQRVENDGDLIDDAVRSAGNRLETEFVKMSDKLPEERLKKILASTVIAKNGYICILDYEGNYILSKQRKLDGQNVWYIQDSQGRFFARDIIAKGRALKKGDLAYDKYTCSDTGESGNKERVIAIMHIPEKRWIVVVTVYSEDLSKVNFKEAKIEELKALMAEQKIGRSGHLYVIDTQGKDKGRYILSKDRKKDGGDALSLRNIKQNPFIQDIIEAAPLLKDGECGIKYYRLDGREGSSSRLQLMTYVYFEPWNWIIGASVYPDEFLTGITRMKRVVILFCLVTIFFSSLVAYLFTSNMTDTVTKLADKMAMVTRGNLDMDMSDIELQDNGNEIGKLSNAFNQMANSLKKTAIAKDYVDNILANINDALLVIDKSGKIKTVNDTACNLLGYHKNEMLRHPIDDFFVSGAETWGLKGVIAGIFQGKAVVDQKIEFKNKGGFPVVLSFNGVPFKDSRGDITSAILTVRDIRELKDARRKLEEKTVEAHMLSKELDDFAYMVSNDLKVPLRDIEAFSRFLSGKYKDKLDQEGNHYLEVIKKSLAKIQILINDLSEFSQISRKEEPYEAVDLNMLMSDIKDSFALLLRERNADIKVLSLPTVKCDRVRITKLFTNLIDNAIKHNDKNNPVIEVGCEYSDDKEIKCYVKDNGRGIPKESQEKIFELFQKLEGNTQEGTGVGLTICKKIVESCGGTIWVESEPDKGSVFCFTIPKRNLHWYG